MLRRLQKLLIVGIWAAAICVTYRATITLADALYEIDGGGGVVTFTSRRPTSGVKYRSIGFKSPRFSKVYRNSGYGYEWKARPRNTEFDALIESLANEFGVETALARAVVHVESAFNPYAFSPKGAMGLMQLMPGTAKRYGVRDPWHPEQNVRGGLKYLKWLIDRYNGNLRLALAAYNAGEDNVDRIMAVPPFAETVEYVKRVTKALDMYRCINDGNKNC